MTTIGCVLVTHNRLNLTKRTIETLWATLPEYARLILFVYDNASTDGTKEWLLEQHQNGRIAQVLLDSENRYPGYAYNRAWGLLLAHGVEYLMATDNDIVFLDGWLDEGLKVMRAMPEMGLVGLLNNLQDTPPDLRETKITKYERNGVEVNCAFPNVAGTFLMRNVCYQGGGRWPEGDWSKITWPAYHFNKSVRENVGAMHCNVIPTVAYESAYEDYVQNEEYYRRTFRLRGVEHLLDERIEKLKNNEIKDGYVGGKT